MTPRRPHLLFVPGGGGVGSGESFRSLMLAQGVRERRPEARIGFVLGAGHRDVGFDAFERHPVAGRVSRNHAGVQERLRRARPDVVVFDNRGSTASIAAAARLGARVVFVADAPQILRRALRLRRLRRLDELWLVQRRFGPAPARLRAAERLRLVIARGPRVRFFDALFPPPRAERRARLLTDLGLDGRPYALFLAGGGGTRHAGRPAPEIFAEEAARVHRATGLTCVALMGPLHEGPAPRHEGVRVLDALPPPSLIDLLSQARVVACGGGVTSIQALTLGRLCVVASTGGADQPERIQACARAGWIRPASLEPGSLSDGVQTVLGDAGLQERMRAALAAGGLRNGMPEAVDGLVSLLDRP